MNRRRQCVLGAGTLALGLSSSVVAQVVAGKALIGWIAYTDAGVRLEDFREGLRGLGYTGVRELRIETRLVQRDLRSVLTAVDDVLRMGAPLVVAHANAATLVQNAVAGRVPVVIAFSGDPVEAGLVQSFARPGGNTTGMSFMALDLVGKRLEVIKEIAPGMQRVAILANPQHPGERAERRESLAAAQRLGLQAVYIEFDPASPFEAALDAVRRAHCHALVVFPDAGMLARAAQTAAFALKERLLCISGWAEFAQAGCIASYGPNLRDGYRRLAYYADRLLRGAHPSSLPVELPARIEMVLNVRTARALGLTIPQALLLRADEVIE